MTIRITIEDTIAGTREVKEVDDWHILTVGRYYIANEQHYPQAGTVVFTIKRAKPSAGSTGENDV